MLRTISGMLARRFDSWSSIRLTMLSFISSSFCNKKELGSVSMLPFSAVALLLDIVGGYGV